MDWATTRSFSSRRLAFGLAIVAAFAAIDAALASHPLTVVTAVLVVPLVLAAVGDQREVMITGAGAMIVVLVHAVWDDSATSQQVFRIVLVAVFVVLAVVTAGSRQRAAAMAESNRALAVELGGVRAQLDGILGALAEAVTVHDERGRTIYANQAAAELLGSASPEELLAAEPGDLGARFAITDEAGERVPLDRMPGRRLIAGEDAPALLTRSVRRSDGEAFWLLTKATLYRDPSGVQLAINVIEDVTEGKDAELRQRFLAEAGQLLASSLDYGQTLDRVARMLVPRLADWCGIDMLDEHGELKQVAVAHVDPAKVELAHELRRRYPPDMDAPSGVPAILRGGPSELYAEIPDALLVDAAVDEEHLRVIREVGMRSAMAVPMRFGTATLGVLTLVSAESGRRFDEDDLAFAEDLALRAATAVQNAELYTAQERVAHTLQASLLPERLPDVPGWEIHAVYQAGERGSDVGGDFYDVVPVESGHLIVLGDVTGKGVEAAALTSLVRHSVRMAARFDPRPARVLSLVNDVLREQSRLSLVTAVCALLEEGKGLARLTVASAGHPLPLCRSSGKGVQTLGTHGVLLGVGEEEDWTEVAVRVEPGDTLLFYTDGVTETPGDRERFGEARLHRAMSRAAPGSEALVEEIERTLRDFQAGAAVDDRAMLAMRFLGVAIASAAA